MKEREAMRILHQTKDYAVIFKPAGMLSQSAPGGGEDAVSLLKAHFQSEIYPIHRLDRGTAGVMVYGKSAFGAAALSKAISAGRFHKEYLAVCHGICPEEGRMVDLLLHRSEGNKSFVVDRMRGGVKEARLTFTRLSTLDEPEALSLVRVRLETGRTHQIRVQFAHRGHVLYGDGKYGAHSPGEPMLFCEKLVFPEPGSGREVCFTAAPEGGIWARFL